MPQNHLLPFLQTLNIKKNLKKSKSIAIITSACDVDEDNKNYIVNADPYLVYAKVSQLFKNSNFELENKIIHPSAVITN